MDNKHQDRLRALGNKQTTYKNMYDVSLIDIIARLPRRQNFKKEMVGMDIWRAYEMSFLLPAGLPQFMLLEINIPAHSVYIPESKSLKLYLNSFNQSIFKDKHMVLETIQNDLSEKLQGNVLVQEINKTYFAEAEEWYENCLLKEAVCLDNLSVPISKYVYDKQLLKKNKSKNKNTITRYSNLLRSNCEITGQPDWGRVVIQYIPQETILEDTSLLQYIVSYRMHQEFHEPTCERIYNDIFEAVEPKNLLVICQYTRRGGIDINPVRSNSFYNIHSILLPKILQQ